MKKSTTLNSFGITFSQLNAVFDAALSQGGDYCDLYFEHTISHGLGMEDDAVNRAYSDVDFGVGIRVLSGEQTGYSFTEEISQATLIRAAKTAAEIASNDKSLPTARLIRRSRPEYYPAKESWEKVGIDRKLPLLQRLNERVYSLDSRIIKTTLILSSEVSKVTIATSDGIFVSDERPLFRMAVSCVAEDKGRKEQNSYSISRRCGFEFVTPEVLDHLARETVQRTVILFDAVKPGAGQMPVVMAAGHSGILLHEAIGHGMEADFNRKKVSIFCDKVGRQVAEPFVTIVDSGVNPGSRGSLNIDDEGNDTQETVLVENGILQGYLHDRISAAHYQVAPTGNGRRQDFRHPPMPRMRNTYMLNGPHSKDDIIAGVAHGLYAESFSNGQVHIGGGDFTFYVKNGYLIENGRLDHPVKDVNIIGNGPDVLKQITMVADDFEMSEGGWTCGKNGQGVPVSQGMPTVKVAKMTVGGL